MSTPASTSPPLPHWVIAGLSAAILFHFTAIGGLVLAANSGPWITTFGNSTALGPPFAVTINELTARNYLAPIQMTHNYHFVSNAPELPAIYFEVLLKDAGGKVIKTLRFPDEKANPFVRSRHERLAQGLGDDQPVQAPQGEQVMPEGKKHPAMNVWLPSESDASLHLKSVTALELPRNRPVFRPSEWSLLLARAYVRHLCRAYGAVSGELIRHSRSPIQPSVLFFTGPLPPNTFEELVCNFGDYRP